LQAKGFLKKSSQTISSKHGMSLVKGNTFSHKVGNAWESKGGRPKCDQPSRGFIKSPKCSKCHLVIKTSLNGTYWIVRIISMGIITM
jgi:hypothetical protein